MLLETRYTKLTKRKVESVVLRFLGSTVPAVFGIDAGLFLLLYKLETKLLIVELVYS